MGNPLVGIMLVSLLFSPNPTTSVATLVTAKNTVLKNYKTEDTLYNYRRILPIRWIDINLSQQRLSAMEGKKVVYSFLVSTGKSSTPTVTGKFLINSKYRETQMQGQDYNVPDVPYTMYFYEGYAIHGAYWHDEFGTPVSHGCVNVPVNLAAKLYNWSSVGTLVVVHY